MKSMIKAALCCSMLVLASCGGDGTTTTPPANSEAANVVVVANTGTLTVRVTDRIGDPYAGAIVSIGDTGQIVATTNAAGEAVFTGLTAGAVDIHVFDTVSNVAKSAYGVNSDAFTVVLGSIGIGSVVDFNITVVNGNGTESYIFKTAKGSYDGVPTQNGVTFYMSDDAVGTSVTGVLWAVQGNALSVAGNTASGPAEAVNLASQTVTTTALSAAPAGASIIATFSATPVVAPANLVTINSITPPAGLPLLGAGAGAAFIEASATGFVLPDTIQSADTQDYSAYAYATNDTGAGGDLWASFSPFTAGGTITFTPPQFTSLIAAASPQTGKTIAWTNAASNSAILATRIHLEDVTTWVTLWDIIVPNGVSSVTLPTLPTGVTSPLTAGTAYNLTFTSDIIPGITYEQLAIAGSAGLTNGELMVLNGGILNH